MISALFVETNGVYRDLGLDVWGIERDARAYDGPNRVIAHPPCQRWGRYWSGGPSARVRRKLGDDEGCFASALVSVWRYGGVIEHPEASHAWRVFGIPKPPKSGGWIPAVFPWAAGWTCCVEQGHYGHAARKATWLYLARRERPVDLIGGPAATTERKTVERLSKHERIATPRAFAELLVGLV